MSRSSVAGACGSIAPSASTCITVRPRAIRRGVTRMVRWHDNGSFSAHINVTRRFAASIVTLSIPALNASVRASRSYTTRPSAS